MDNAPHIENLLKLLDKPVVDQQRKSLRQMVDYYRSAKISIIPVAKNKKPLIPWKDYQDRYATDKEVAEWLEKYPEMQLGIVTGKISNLIVVDIEAGGDYSWLPPTAIAKTGGGGRHYYYSYVPGVTNKARIKELVDLRGDGGYVIAPPSVSDKGAYEWLERVQPVVFPKYLFDDNKSVIRPEYAMPDPNQFSGVTQGERNSKMASFIGRVLREVHPADWDSIGWLRVKQANDLNKPPLSERELMTVFTSIKNAEKRSNQFRWQANAGAETNDLWNDEDDQIVTFEEAAAKQSVNIHEKMKLGLPMFDDALQGGVNAGDLVVISGATSNGKTSFAQTITHNLVEQVYPCLWFSYEVLVGYLWDKFKRMGISEEWFAYIPFKHVTGDVRWIEKKILEAKKRFMVKAVFIDHLGFLMPGNSSDKRVRENYSAYLGIICRELKTLAIREKIVIFLMAHLRKTEEPSINDLYSSVAIAQEADAVFMVVREVNQEEGSTEYYTPYTQIILMKNRKTGITNKHWFSMVDEKFVPESMYEPIPKRKKKKYYNPPQYKD